MAVKRIEDLHEGDRFRFGLHEFVVATISTKEENTERCEDFVDVFLGAISTCGRFKISCFFAEGMKVDVVRPPRKVS